MPTDILPSLTRQREIRHHLGKPGIVFLKRYFHPVETINSSYFQKVKIYFETNLYKIKKKNPDGWLNNQKNQFDEFLDQWKINRAFNKHSHINRAQIRNQDPSKKSL